MSSVAERLRLGIEEKMGGNVNEFHRAMKGRLEDTEVRGYTYPSISKYLDGDVSPRLEFLFYAAEELGVRYAWLASGEGEMTDELQAKAEARWRAQVRGGPGRLDPGVTEGFGVAFGVDPKDMKEGPEVIQHALDTRLGRQAAPALLRAWGAAADSGLVEAAANVSERKARSREIAERVARSTSEVFQQFDLRPEELGPYAAEHFIIAVSIALTHLFERARERGLPTRINRSEFIKQEDGDDAN